MLKWIMGTAIVTIVAAVVITWEAKCCETARQECQAATARYPLTNPMLIVASGKDGNANQEKSQNQTSGSCAHADTYLCRVLTTSNLPTIYLVLVGIGGIVAAIGTLGVIQKQTDITAEMLANVVAKERPRVRVELEEPILSLADLPPRIQVKIDWYCPTPAFFVEGEVAAYLSSRVPSIPSIPSIPQFLPIYMPSFIKDGGVQTTWAVTFEKFDQETFDQIRDGKVVLFCRGYIRWKGIHLRDDDIPYGENFDFSWVPYDEPVAGFRGHWEAVKKEENETKWKAMKGT